MITIIRHMYVAPRHARESMHLPAPPEFYRESVSIIAPSLVPLSAVIVPVLFRRLFRTSDIFPPTPDSIEGDADNENQYSYKNAGHFLSNSSLLHLYGFIGAVLRLLNRLLNGQVVGIGDNLPLFCLYFDVK